MNPKQIITEQPKLKHKGLKLFVIILLSFLAIGSIGYSVYAWQQNSRLVNELSHKEDDNKKLRDENAALKHATKAMSYEQQDSPQASDHELAQRAAQDFIDAQVLDMKYIATSPEVKGNFASSGVAPSDQSSHIVSGLLLKKTNENWVVIYDGQNDPDQDTITRFAIPEEFRSYP
ncbi:MAG TPA: hypothetical protein VFT59_05325 [Candidatus Saccharimonadales bacterium]|nr:hypothetical protein [Candidatus Saccharimonadales bacterium]